MLEIKQIWTGIVIWLTKLSCSSKPVTSKSETKCEAWLDVDTDLCRLLKICKQQGVEFHSLAHLLRRPDTQLEQGDISDPEQKHIAATELATLLFRELFLPPANHAPHTELLAAALTSLYPDLAPDVSGATDVSDKPAIGTEQNDLFFAPKNLEFRSLGYYKPLSRRKKEIRLVSVRAGKQDQDIQCTLMNPISLADIQSELLDPSLYRDKQHHPYTALSYAAGDLKKTAKIHVNNVVFEVYESLERALRRIRHKKHAVHVWIDQICIDQHDTAEKAWQVGIMRDVYSAARKTLVFLDIRGHDYLAADFKRFFAMVYEQAFGSVIDMPTNSSGHTSLNEILSQQLDLSRPECMERSRLVLSQQHQTAQWLASVMSRAEYLPSVRYLAAMYSVSWWHRSWVSPSVIVAEFEFERSPELMI